MSDKLSNATNQVGIAQVWPFLDSDEVVVGWLPWNHTFGGNLITNMVLAHGGTFYIDHDNPTPMGLPTMAQNIKDVSPTMYFGVPRSYTALYAKMKEDEALQRAFFKRLKFILPLPGVSIKLTPDPSGKREMRVKGPNVTRGYDNSPSATAAAFDEEGYYRTGDAGRFLDPDNPAAGLVLDGRIGEDFKLTSRAAIG